MYEAIRGYLREKEPLKAVVETNGISYRLSIPLSTYAKLPALDSSVHLFLSHIVREDAHTLYAFFERQERNFFEMLLNLSGIGPKTASGIVGHMDFSTFQRAVCASDAATLGKLPGIGKKTAERIIVELRDKLEKQGVLGEKSPLFRGNDSVLDAVSALVNLGYTTINAQKAVEKAMQQTPDLQDLGKIITAALRCL